ncbi:MAG: putative toxin-antitoxin system toxin component, PIN family [Bacteroidota bacterium]|nr:putative toxin-antitoxin system toxin component, PIN family [Bacteroidota bacterium]
MMMLFYRWVLDPNILVSYCISARLRELPALIEKYNVEFVANETLMSEFAEVIARERVRKYLLKEPGSYIDVETRFASVLATEKYYRGSPDINDDYLIDVVRQSKAVGRVTADKALLK